MKKQRKGLIEKGLFVAQKFISEFEYLAVENGPV
jgi:hypothetical protein